MKCKENPFKHRGCRDVYFHDLDLDRIWKHFAKGRVSAMGQACWNTGPEVPEHLVTSELIRLGQNGEAMSDGAFLDADSLCACCSCLVWTCLDCGENPNPLVFIKIGHRMEVSPFGHAHQAPEIVVPPRELREPQSSEEPWWTNAKLPGEPRHSPWSIGRSIEWFNDSMDISFLRSYWIVDPDNPDTLIWYLFIFIW